MLVWTFADKKLRHICLKIRPKLRRNNRRFFMGVGCVLSNRHSPPPQFLHRWIGKWFSYKRCNRLFPLSSTFLRKKIQIFVFESPLTVGIRGNVCACSAEGAFCASIIFGSTRFCSRFTYLFASACDDFSQCCLKRYCFFPSKQELTLPRWMPSWILWFLGYILGWCEGCSVEMLTGRIANFAVRQLPKTLSEVRNMQSLLLCWVTQFIMTGVV